MKRIFVIFLVLAGFVSGFFASNYVKIINEKRASDGLYYLGLEEVKNENVGDAIEKFYISLHYNSKNALAHQGLAFIYYDLGQYFLAEEEFSEFIANSSENSIIVESKIIQKDIPIAYCYLGDIYERVGDYKKSDSIFKRMQKDYPDLPNYLDAYVKMLARKNDLSESDKKRLSLYSKCIEKLQQIPTLSGG